jgi:hypothetical protein
VVVYTTEIPALWRLRQWDQEFKASQDYRETLYQI